MMYYKPTPTSAPSSFKVVVSSFDKFQFGTSAMVASDFEGLRGYGTLEYEGQVPTHKALII